VDVKCAKNEVPEISFHIQIVSYSHCAKFCGVNKCIPFQDIFANYSAVPNFYSAGTQKYKNENMRVGNFLYQIWVNQLLLLIVEKQKIPILDFFGLTYKRRTKCWSLRLDISSRRQYLCTCTYTYAMMIFIGGMGEGLQNKIINQPNKNDEAFLFSFNTICINFSLFSLGLLSLVGKIYMVLRGGSRGGGAHPACTPP